MLIEMSSLPFNTPFSKTRKKTKSRGIRIQPRILMPESFGIFPRLAIFIGNIGFSLTKDQRGEEAHRWQLVRLRLHILPQQNASTSASLKTGATSAYASISGGPTSIFEFDDNQGFFIAICFFINCY